ncbi:MAG: sugar ABC transporter permease [Anaerolineae bacterium]|nr:sugar ABC transporter permease [Anaerolineae bacterium]
MAQGDVRQPAAATSLSGAAGSMTATMPGSTAIWHEPTKGWARTRYEIKKSNKWGYIFIAPLLLDFLIFTAYMVIRAVTMSFQEIALGSTTWVGLTHFIKIVKNDLFWNAMKNTVVYTIGVVPGGILVALILSELIFRRSERAQVFFKSAYYLPGVVSSVVLAIVWTWIFQPFYGLLNYVIGLFGAAPNNWLGNPDTAMISLIAMSIVGGTGGSVVLLTAAMGGIPTDLYDAAKIDGASEWVRFWRITTPLLRPTLLYLFVVGFIGNFQVFDQIYVMTQGGPGFPGATETVGYLIYSTAFTSLQLGPAAAQSMLLFLFILAFSFFQFRIFASEVEY